MKILKQYHKILKKLLFLFKVVNYKWNIKIYVHILYMYMYMYQILVDWHGNCIKKYCSNARSVCIDRTLQHAYVPDSYQPIDRKTVRNISL